MFAHIKGILEEIYEDRVVVDVNGVGYNIHVSTRVLGDLPDTGAEVKLYTFTSVREDAFILFGFLDKEDLFLFKKLITVNGIGPKGALSILSGLDAQELRYAILSGDSKLLSLSPGIGKKTAERIILDLKDKIDWDVNAISSDIMKNKQSGSASGALGGVRSEAVEALVSLGYNRKEASSAVFKTGSDEDTDVEAILKEALKYLM
ncbi:MAG: Holliday junction branch migration protein RuvA [Lachnospiraceae bacterium]|nr:Holliday junction branch migration protein RuvA [Lachnospiraceae bacterium]